MAQGVLDDPRDLEGLKPFATPTQLRYLNAVLKEGSHVKAAESLGASRQLITAAIGRVKKQAAKRGWAPENGMTEVTAEGFGVDGVSGYYKVDPETGEKTLTGQWIKQKAEKEKLLEAALEAVKEVFSLPEMKVPRAKRDRKVLNDDLLIVYPMGDPHIGMYAWAKESGDDFDVKIAERNLVTAMQRLVECAPAGKHALIVNVGDFFHSDTMDNRTARSGNALDVDTRWAQVLRVGVRAMRACIEAALRKHETVRVINEIGNHDDHTAQVLTLALDMAYENNPRVSFDDGPGRFHYHRFGDVLLGVTHGDLAKPEKLGEIMAVDRQEDWGTTKFRYWFTGHIHVRKVFELPGCMVESFRTLAAKDAWTASMGYRSGRDMYAIALHKKYGEVERHRADIIMIEE